MRLAYGVADSGGVTLVPAFSGLGAPHWDRDATAIISGLTQSTTGAQIARAAVEAVAHQICDIVEAIEADSNRLSVLRADGGVTVSDLAMQIQADLLGRDVEVADIAEVSALGAAKLGWQSLVTRARLELRSRPPADVSPTVDSAERRRRRAVWRVRSPEPAWLPPRTRSPTTPPAAPVAGGRDRVHRADHRAPYLDVDAWVEFTHLRRSASAGRSSTTAAPPGGFASPPPRPTAPGTGHVRRPTGPHLHPGPRHPSQPARRPTPTRTWPAARIRPIAPGARTFCYADGSPLFLVIDTAWALPWRATLDDVAVYAADRQAKGFNAVLMMSVQPDMNTRGPEGRNIDEGFEVGFRDLPDGHLTEINIDYFQYFDRIVDVLVGHGLTPILQPVFQGFGWKGNRSPAMWSRLLSTPATAATSWPGSAPGRRSTCRVPTESAASPRPRPAAGDPRLGRVRPAHRHPLPTPHEGQQASGRRLAGLPVLPDRPYGGPCPRSGGHHLGATAAQGGHQRRTQL